MTKTICSLTFLVCLTSAVPSTAQTTLADAQTMVSINVGAQMNEHTFTTANSFDLFEETASFSADHKVDQGALFDLSAARKVWRKLWISGGFWTFTKTGTAGVTASIPNPIFFNRPVVTNTSASGLKHTEVGIDFAAMWAEPITDKITIAVFAGPSFIHLSQDLVQGVTADASQVASAAVSNQSATAKGGNVGVDASYAFNKTWALGAFFRYVGGSAHLESVSVKVGGAQAGVGARIMF